jgi:hypothetical protein
MSKEQPNPCNKFPANLKFFFAKKLSEPRFMGLKRLAGFFPFRHCEPQAKQSRKNRLVRIISIGIRAVGNKRMSVGF